MKTLIKSALFMLFLLPMSFFAQNTVSGTVIESATGLPIPGVNVIVQGTSNGTTTDFDGNYTIENVANDDILTFSFLGFATQEIPYEGQATLDVSLDEDAASLDEVVLIGYGATTEQDATGAVDKISPESFNQGAVVSPQELIAGKSAGVQITPSGGAPGEGGTIRIRGGASLSASNDPLIVVDGVPLDQRGVQGSRNALNSINPNEIENFVILKDAAATSIYGSRASNGVILITTKTGKKDSPFQFTYDVKISAGKIMDKVDVLNADQFRELIQNTPGTNPDLLGDTSTDWQDQIYQTAEGVIHNLTASQGFGNFYYRVNFNHTEEKGVLKRDYYERNALNIALNQDLFDNKLKFTLTSKNSLDQNRFANRGAIGAAVAFDPTQPIFDPGSPFGGYFEFTRQTDDGITQQNLATKNPLALLQLTDDSNQVRRSITNLNTEYRFHFLPELKAVVNAGFDYAEADGSTFTPLTSAANTTNIEQFSNYDNINRNLLLDTYLNYKKQIDFFDTDIDLTAGHSFQEFYSYSNSVGTEQDQIIDFPESINRNALESYFARASFDINNRYLISGSFRADGSSRVAPQNRWGYFPAASVGWKVHNEAFLENSNFLTQLKLRAGYGETGNYEIGRNYGYLGLYTPSIGGARYQFGNEFVPTLRPEEFDENLRWETLINYNAGIDFGFFDNRLSGSIDGYYRETKDLIATVPVPAGANLSDQLLTNVGATVSKGIEIGLTGDIARSENFNWTLNYNITFQEREITELSLGENPNFFIPQGGISGGVGNTVQLWKEGFDPTTFFVFRQVYDQEGNPIEGAYVDVNGDNQITEADRQAYKKATPDYFMGLTNTMNYKNFDLNFTFRGNFGNYIYNNTQSANGFIEAGTNTPSDYYSNLNANVLETGFENSQFFSDYYIRSADFVKLDNLSIGYTVAGEEVDFRASVTASNVLTITNYEGLDPEVFGGIDNNFYPRSRRYVLGLSITF
ncbi:SusC/RagA family TonB-linked outer membrane protein [Christiangramia sp.]|uniref:SusC/RagA family TonB-linked outer membrane protein n=1 Tax=Christiangramia sp. TaxID=1931228 RepID=UPI00262AF7AF|nr:SusC/RagA family TonB-linked outer membrane protein [Christiangramia sp.]